VSEDPWRTLGSRTVYTNAWLRLREDTVIRPDGQPGIYGVVEMNPSVGVVAVNDVNEIALVTQWRYTLGRIAVEIPTGGSEASDPSMLAALGLASGVGLQLAATVLVGLGLGYVADRALHTSPWFLLVGLLLGILGGGYSVVRRLMKEIGRSG